MTRRDDNIRNVEAFLALAFEQGRSREAVEQFVGSEYTQHSPTIPDGKEAFIEMAGMFAAVMGDIRIVRKLVVADDDHVVLLSHLVPADGSPGRALVDIMRLDADGKIVEHWDIGQEIPAAEAFAHDNGMF